MFYNNFKTYVFLIELAVFYNQHNLIMALIGPNVVPARRNEFPALVSIMRMVNFENLQMETLHRCTGTLVSKQDVLTAEHCLRTVFVEPFKVLLGSHDLRNAMEYSPLYTWTYEHWALFRRRRVKYLENDIAFVKIIGNAPEHIDFAPIGNLDNTLLYGLTVQSAGWGRLNNGSIPRYLQKVSLKVLTKEECEERYFLIEHEFTTMYKPEICTVGEPYAILGHGDSGGPLLFFGTVVGVNNGICPPVCLFRGGTEHLNVHVGIRYYFEFIQDMTHRFYISF